MDFSIPPLAQKLVDASTALADALVIEHSGRAPQLFGDDAERRSRGEDGRLVAEVFAIRADARTKAHGLGLYGAFMPREAGGAGLSVLETAIVEEALANRPAYPQVFWPDLTIHLLGRAWGPTPVLLAGSPAIQQRYLAPLMAATQTTCIALTEADAGSDPQNMRATAVREGDVYRIDGTKRFIGNGPYADFVMVYARTSGVPGDIKGISLLIVDKNTPGFTVARVMGVMEGVGNHGELVFEDCRVPAENIVGAEGEGFRYAMKYVSQARLTIAARCIGGAQFLLDATIARAKKRQTFGAPLAERQAIQWMIADVATEIEELRWLVRYAAWKIDSGGQARRETAMAKLRGPQVYHHAADVAMQVHGGEGFTTSLPIERAYRRARGYRFIEGTDEMQRRSLAADLLR
jgi:alkylation response protein AidB-like acyl-CoA dehydrogenase